MSLTRPPEQLMVKPCL